MGGLHPLPGAGQRPARGAGEGVHARILKDSILERYARGATPLAMQAMALVKEVDDEFDDDEDGHDGEEWFTAAEFVGGVGVFFSSYPYHHDGKES